MAKFLFILDNLEIGGVERNTIHLGNHLAEHGHDVTLLCLTEQGPMVDAISGKVKQYYLRCKRVRWSLFKIAHYLRQHDFDAVISAKEYNNVMTIAASKLTGKKIKVVTTTRTHLVEEKTKGKSKIFFCTLLLARWLYPLAWKRVAVSHGVAQGVRDALNLPALDVDVIYNPAANSRIFYIQPLPPHAWLSGPRTTPVLVACGRLSLAKDYEFLINAFNSLNKRMLARLIIIGDGELRSELEAQIKDLGLNKIIHMVGFVPNPEDYMYHADAFVMTSKWEGFGNVLVEALSVGCPIIAMDCPGGVREILGNGRWGKIVSHRDPEIFADNVIAELQGNNDPRPYQYLQERARIFTPERIAADYLALLD